MMKDQRTWHGATAWTLVIIATVFWLWFGIGSAYVEEGGALNWLMHILMPGGIFLGTSLITWCWEKIGGGLFVLEGLLALGLVVNAFLRVNFPISTLILRCLTLSLPSLAAGALFLTSIRDLRSSV